MAIINPGYQFVEEKLHESAVFSASGHGIVIGGLGNLTIQAEGMNGDTLTPKVSNGVTYVGCQVVNVTSGAVATTIGADGIYRLRNMGAKFFCAELTRVAGTVTVIVVGAPQGSMTADG